MYIASDGLAMIEFIHDENKYMNITPEYDFIVYNLKDKIDEIKELLSKIDESQYKNAHSIFTFIINNYEDSKDTFKYHYLCVLNNCIYMYCIKDEKLPIFISCGIVRNPLIHGKPNLSITLIKKSINFIKFLHPECKYYIVKPV